MFRLGLFLAAALVIIHGLVHLLGFVAYWPLAELAELPYKTSLLGSRWPVGPGGMRFFSVLWLATAVSFTAAGISLLNGRSWWLPVMLAAVVLSLVITALDWRNAFRGTILSLLMLVPVLLVWGLRVQPQPFTPFPEPTQRQTAVALPIDLPAPVARYYKTVMGDEMVPVETAVITMRGHLRFAGITFPARLRFTHQAGQGYRHYIEATLFGRPLLKVNERFLDGQARLALPMGVVQNEPKVDMAANLGLWGESVWLPSIYLTDPRVRWEGLDETTARLIVPFGSDEDSFTVYFDAETGLIRRMEAMRYRDADSTEKILWWFEPLGWTEFNGVLIPSSAAVTWADEGTPWLVADVEALVYNVDVQHYIRAEGP